MKRKWVVRFIGAMVVASAAMRLPDLRYMIYSGELQTMLYGFTGGAALLLLPAGGLGLILLKRWGFYCLFAAVVLGFFSFPVSLLPFVDFYFIRGSLVYYLIQLPVIAWLIWAYEREFARPEPRRDQLPGRYEPDVNANVQSALGLDADANVSVKHKDITLQEAGVSTGIYIAKELGMFVVTAGLGAGVIVSFGAGGASGAIIGFLLVYFFFVVKAILKALKGGRTRHSETRIIIDGIHGFESRLDDWLRENKFQPALKDGNVYVYRRSKTPSMVVTWSGHADSLTLNVSIKDAVSGQRFNLGKGVYGGLVRPRARKLINGLLRTLGVSEQSFA